MKLLLTGKAKDVFDYLERLARAGVTFEQIAKLVEG